VDQSMLTGTPQGMAKKRFEDHQTDKSTGTTSKSLTTANPREHFQITFSLHFCVKTTHHHRENRGLYSAFLKIFPKPQKPTKASNANNQLEQGKVVVENGTETNSLSAPPAKKTLPYSRPERRRGKQ